MRPLLVFLLCWTLNVHAQTSQSIPVTVQANLVKGLSVVPSAGSDGLSNLNLGAAIQSATGANTNSPSSNSANSTAANVNPNSNPSAGLITVNGSPRTPMTITYRTAVPLIANGQDESSSFDFVPQVVGATASTMQRSAAPLPSGSTISLGSTGSFYLWLGGSVNIPPGQAPGTYTGVFDITIGY